MRNRARYKIRVINLSLGHVPTSSYRDDPMAQAVERAVAAGLVVVASAGNSGKTADGTPIVGAVVSPGFTPGALTVGALTPRGRSCGLTTAWRPTVRGVRSAIRTIRRRGRSSRTSWRLGNAIVAAGLPGTHLYDSYPERRVAGCQRRHVPDVVGHEHGDGGRVWRGRAVAAGRPGLSTPPR